MGCGGMMKVFLVIFNILFILIGGATLALGVWVMFDQKFLLDLTKNVTGTDLNDTDIPSLLENAVLVLIIAGGCIFVIGFIGCCGALTNKTKCGKLLLKMYAVIVLIILILELAGVCLAWVFFDKLEEKLQEYLDTSLTKRYQGNFTSTSTSGVFSYTSGGDPITLAWDIVQIEFECCGRNNGSDYDTINTLLWNTYRNYTDSNGNIAQYVVPPSCCAVSGASDTLLASLKKGTSTTFNLIDPQCPYRPVPANSTGCYDSVKKSIVNNSIIFLGVGGGTVFIEVCIILAAVSLAVPRQIEEHITRRAT